jgi:hypothetical protein
LPIPAKPLGGENAERTEAVRPGRAMSVLDILAWIVLLLLLLSAIAIALVLGALPGYVARRRQHPFAQAVMIAGWISLIFIPLWPFALVWAYVERPRRGAVADLDDVQRRLADVERPLHIREAAE